MIRLVPRPLAIVPRVLVLALAMTATACTGTGDGRPHPPNPSRTATGNNGVLDLPWNLDGPAPTGDGSSLYDTEWVLSSIQIDDHVSWPDEFRWGLTLVFRRNGTVYVRSDCGDWKAGTTAKKETPISGAVQVHNRPCPAEAAEVIQDRLRTFDQPLRYGRGHQSLRLSAPPQGLYYDFDFTAKR